MYLYFVVMNGFVRSEEVVTEPALHISRCISILRIILTKDAKFEIAQILEKTSIDQIGFSSECRCPPPIHSRQSLDCQ